jgi:DNA-binding NarL/FixJ family response regulator
MLQGNFTLLRFAAGNFVMADDPLYHGNALLVEDDPFMRQSVASFLTDFGFEVNAASTYAQAVALLEGGATSFQLAIVDLSLPERSDEDIVPRAPLGLVITRQIKQTHPQMGVVVWSAYTHHLPDILSLVDEGHRGLAYVPKGSRAKTLRLAIDLVMAGDVYLPSNAIARSAPDAVARFLHALRPDVALAVQNVEARLDLLTPRQLEVATLLALRPDAIAKELGLGEKTIRNYVDSVYETLDLKDIATQDLRRDSLIVLAILLRRLRDPGLAGREAGR